MKIRLSCLNAAYPGFYVPVGARCTCPNCEEKMDGIQIGEIFYEANSQNENWIAEVHRLRARVEKLEEAIRNASTVTVYCGCINRSLLKDLLAVLYEEEK